MDQQAMSAFAVRVLTDAERVFGPAADGALLDRFAREAAIELWATATTPVTVSVAEAALRAFRLARERRRPARSVR